MYLYIPWVYTNTLFQQMSLLHPYNFLITYFQRYLWTTQNYLGYLCIYLKVLNSFSNTFPVQL